MTAIFRWYSADGTIVDDSPDICKRIDGGEPGWFGTPEGAIIHGGVIATAFERKTEEVFDGYEAVMHGRRVSAGFRTTTRITACPATPNPGR